MAEGFITRRGGSGSFKTGTVSEIYHNQIGSTEFIGKKNIILDCGTSNSSGFGSAGIIRSVFMIDGVIKAYRHIGKVVEDYSSHVTFNETTGQFHVTNDETYGFADMNYYIFD